MDPIPRTESQTRRHPIAARVRPLVRLPSIPHERITKLVLARAQVRQELMRLTGIQLLTLGIGGAETAIIHILTRFHPAVGIEGPIALRIPPTVPVPVPVPIPITTGTIITAGAGTSIVSPSRFSEPSRPRWRSKRSSMLNWVPAPWTSIGWSSFMPGIWSGEAGSDPPNCPTSQQLLEDAQAVHVRAPAAASTSPCSRRSEGVSAAWN